MREDGVAVIATPKSLRVFQFQGKMLHQMVRECRLIEEDDRELVYVGG